MDLSRRSQGLICKSARYLGGLYKILQLISCDKDRVTKNPLLEKPTISYILETRDKGLVYQFFQCCL